MSRMTAVAMLSVTLASGGCADASRGTSDGAAEAAIRAIVQASEDALNARDFDAFFASYAEDSDLIVFDGPHAAGRAAAHRTMEEGWAEVPADVRADLTVRSIRLVTPDVAIADIDGVFTGSRPSHDRATVVFENTAEGWRVAAARILQAEVGPVAMQAGIDATWDEFETAWEAGDLETVVGLYTADAVNMPGPGQTESGRAEIEVFFGDAFSNGTFEIVERVTTEVGGQGTTAYEFGILEQTYTPNGGQATPYRARYVTVFRLEPDGAWRFHRWMSQPEGQ